MSKTGWICPKCGRVYAPAVTACESCNRELNQNDAKESVKQLEEYLNKIKKLKRQINDALDRNSHPIGKEFAPPYIPKTWKDFEKAEKDKNPWDIQPPMYPDNGITWSLENAQDSGSVLVGDVTGIHWKKPSEVPCRHEYVYNGPGYYTCTKCGHVHEGCTVGYMGQRE